MWSYYFESLSEVFPSYSAKGDMIFKLPSPARIPVPVCSLVSGHLSIQVHTPRLSSRPNISLAQAVWTSAPSPPHTGEKRGKCKKKMKNIFLGSLWQLEGDICVYARLYENQNFLLLGWEATWHAITMIFYFYHILLLMETFVTRCYTETITKSFENPCRKMHCEHISTKLLTRRQYLGVVSRKAHQSELNKVEFSNSSDSSEAESSWINILRKRNNRRRIKYRHRMKRSSSTRTIVSVNSDDNKRQKSNSKCHKYAVFEVIFSA